MYPAPVEYEERPEITRRVFSETRRDWVQEACKDSLSCKVQPTEAPNPQMRNCKPKRKKRLSLRELRRKSKGEEKGTNEGEERGREDRVSELGDRFGDVLDDEEVHEDIKGEEEGYRASSSVENGDGDDHEEEVEGDVEGRRKSSNEEIPSCDVLEVGFCV